jgi:hypothetical protein
MAEIPSYLRDAIRKMLIAVVNLWVWATIIEKRETPTGTWIALIYNSQLEMGGAKELNGKRIRVTMTVEDDDEE